jgi:hypothetical protein
MPVAANNSIPIRHTAELIQCHWCSVRNQKPRRCWLLEISGEEGLRDKRWFRESGEQALLQHR